MYQALLFFIHRTPFFFPFLGLCLGILLQEYSQASTSLSCLPGSIAVLIHLGFFLLPHRKRYQWRNFLPIAYCLLFVSAGQFLLQEKDIRRQKNWIGKLATSTSLSALELIIENIPAEKASTTQVVASIHGLYSGDSAETAVGQILLSSSQKGCLSQLLPGYRILLFKKPTHLVHSENPGERDWATYYARRQITHRCFVKDSNFLIVDNSPKGYVFANAMHTVQRKILALLFANIQDRQAAGLAAALLIGYREQLDPTLQEQYSKTGVVHIIAISGMHLALLGWLLQFFVRPFQKNKIGLLLSQLLIIAIIWFFTLLAGATPSVLRAALAFTIDAVGKLLGRKPLSLNTLTAAGFLLLVIQPYWLWDLGFQLSFSAVLSIVLFAKPIQQLLTTSHRWLHPVTTLIAVTLAAQLLTTPFTLYYFQQFPLGFLLSNLLAVPLSSCILYILLLVMITAGIPWLGPTTGKLAETLIEWMNRYIQLISEIPGIQLSELHWTWAEAFLLLIAIFTGAGWLLLKSKSGATLTGCLGCLLMVLQWVDIFSHQKQEALVAYQSKSTSMVSWIKGNQAIYLLDSNTRTRELKKNVLANASSRFYRIRQQTDTLLTPYFQIAEWIVIVPHRNISPPRPITKNKKTILLLTKSAPFTGNSWIQNPTIQLAILDGTIGTRTRENWKKLLFSHGIPVHDMLTDGAFVYSPPSSTFALLSTLHTP